MQRLVMMLAAAGLTGITLAAPAPADDGAYLHELSTMGVCTDHYAAPGGRSHCKADFADSDAVLLGRQVCRGYASGMDPGEIQALLRREAPINSNAAEVIRLAAEFELC